MPTLKRARRKTANTSAANRRSRKERVDPLIAPADAPIEPGSAPLVIVGVGASAGGLEAFSQVLRGLSPEIGIAIVLIQQAIGVAGETWLWSGLPAGHAVLRATGLRFLVFDAAGLVLMVAAYWFLNARIGWRIPASEEAD